MANDPVVFSLTANIKGLIEGLGTATEAVKKNTDAMMGAFNGLGSMINNLKAPFMALSSLLAGGKIFHDAIEAAGKWNLDTVKLSKSLGSTTQEASVLKVALHGLGIEQDTYTRAVGAVTRQVANGAQGFDRLGIGIRDSHGNLKSATQLMQESVDKINSLNSGIERNAAGVTLFGRQWQDVQPILLLTKERMEEAKKEAEELHLVVGPEGAQKAREYQESLRKVHLIQESLKIQTGNELMPIFVKLGSVMGRDGPKMVEGLGYALKGLITVWYVLKATVETICDVIMAGLEGLWDILSALGKALWQLFKGDFEGAWNTVKNGWKDAQSAAAVGGGMIKESWSQAKKDIEETWKDPPKVNAKPDTTKKPEGFRPESDKQVFQTWEHQLTALKNLRENWYTWDAQRELAYWEEKLSHTKKGTDLYAQALGKVVTARKAANTEEMQLAAETTRIHQQQALAELDAKVQGLQEQLAAGKISQREELQALIELEQQKLAIKTQALEAQMQLEQTSKLQRLKLQADEVEANRAAQQKMQQLRHQITTNQTAQASKYMEPLVKGFQDGISRMLQGTLTFSQAMRGLFGMVRQALLQSVTQMVSDWIGGLAKKLAAWVATKVQELIFHQTTETAKATSTVASATTQATANAVAAGSAAASSAASNGPYGWMIAIPVGLAVVAGVIAMMSSMKSAAGGFDIPAGMNPLVQAHAEEVVLPSPLSKAFREGAKRLMDDNGGSGTGGGVTVQVSGVIDGNHLMRVLHSNEGQAALVSAYAKAQRNGRKAR